MAHDDLPSGKDRSTASGWLRSVRACRPSDRSGGEETFVAQRVGFVQSSPNGPGCVPVLTKPNGRSCEPRSRAIDPLRTFASPVSRVHSGHSASGMAGALSPKSEKRPVDGGVSRIPSLRGTFDDQNDDDQRDRTCIERYLEIAGRGGLWTREIVVA